MAQRLGPMLDAPPPSPRLWHYTLSRSGLIRLAIGGLGAGAIGVWLATQSPSAAPAAPAQNLPQPSAAHADAPLAPPVPEPPAELIARTAEPPATSAHTAKNTKRAAAPTARKAAGSSEATQQPSAASVEASAAASASAAAQPSAAAAPQPASAAEETSDKQASALRPAEKTESPKPAQVRQRSETSLLFEARAALGGDPEAALRLLNEHATRFAGGLLTPEREVLAIDALRRLGRAQEAEVRTRQFRARYPNSLHLLPVAHKASP